MVVSHWLPKIFTRQSTSRRASCLGLELLEDRLTPATFTWTGGSTVDSNWSTGGNWQGGTAPTVATAAGATFVFGTGEAQTTNVNDITGLSLAEITLAGGYSISGNAVTLTGSSGIGISNGSGSNSFSDNITLGNNLTFTEAAGQLTLGGVISGSNSLTQNGSGTLVLSGSNTFTGATKLNGGTLSISADGNLGTVPAMATPGSLTLNGGLLETTTTFTLNANRGISLGAAGGNFYPATGTTLTCNGIVSGTGGLTLAFGPTNSPGTLVLGGNNTYSGGTTIDGIEVSAGIFSGVISISSDANLGKAPATATPGSLTFDGGGLRAASSFTLNPNRGINLAGPVDTLAAFATSPGTTLTYSGKIAGGGTLVKEGPGTLILDGANTYSGGSRIDAGTIQIGNNDQNGSLGTGSIQDGGVLAFDRSDTGFIFSLPIQDNPAFGTLPQAGSVKQIGSGTTILTAANSYTGVTTVSAGTLQDGRNNGVSGGSGLSVSGTGIFDLAGFNQTVTSLADGGVGTGIITDSGAAATLTVNETSNGRFAGTIEGPISLVKTGSSTLILDGTNTYSGTTRISAGTLQLGNGGTTGTLGTGALTADNGTLSFDRSDTVTVGYLI